jgi:hypothetical protein
MPKLTSPRPEPIPSLPAIIRPNTTPNTKTLCHNQQFPRLTYPQPCAKYENATPKLIRPQSEPIIHRSRPTPQHANYESTMPKLTSPRTQFLPSLPTIIRPNTTPNTKTPCQNQQVPKNPKQTYPQPYAKYENATPKLIRPATV